MLQTVKYWSFKNLRNITYISQKNVF